MNNERMKPVYCISSNVTARPGLTTDAVWDAVSGGISGVEFTYDSQLPQGGTWASRLAPEQWAGMEASLQPDGNLSPLERMSRYSIQDALNRCPEAPDPARTLFVFSSTKGNIEWLGMGPDDRNRLTTSAAILAASAGIRTKPVVISNACVSGVSGLIYAASALASGRFDTAIVTGADRLSRFVVSGFASFQALASERCRPFDAARNGINLGEAAATMILSVNPGPAPLARLSGGATSNDANHISGPSRTGAELAQAITRALSVSGLSPENIDLISAHGTATMYNDEMESKAFEAAGVIAAPLHSLKGYLGHTLGAAGVAESALLVECIRRGQTIASLGFETPGVSGRVNVSTKQVPADIRHALKTASGFGGCNAATVWSRVDI